MKVVKLFKYERYGNTIYNAIIKIDNKSYMKVMTVDLKTE